MKTYIEKIQKKFKVNEANPIYTPQFSEKDVLNPDSKIIEYPFRELIGCLQWCATVQRPDVQQCTNVLARLVAKPTTRQMVNAGKKVLIYLMSTADEGITYNPKSESDFRKIYQGLLSGNSSTDAVLPDVNVFSDASFASCSVSFKSTSGQVLYYRGTPIMWKSSKQTVRAYSTQESEFIACSDQIVMSQSIGFMEFFRGSSGGEASDDKIYWVDNKSAIAIANQQEVRPKCRHFQLRYLRVRDEAKRLQFVPTHLQKQDPLTKAASKSQRQLLFHHTYNDSKIDEGEDNYDLEYDDDGTQFLCTNATCYISSFRGGEC